MNIVRALLVFFSERAGGRPFNNCMLVPMCMVLRWMGYDISEGYDDVMREATGVPNYKPGAPPTGNDPNGTPIGLSWADVKRALDKLFPNAPVTFGTLSEQALIDLLPRPGHRNRHRAAVEVHVECQKMPHHLRRLVGYGYLGGHGIGLGGQKTGAPDFEPKPDEQSQLVLWLDPMGRPAKGYVGEWVRLADVLPAISLGKDGNIRTAYGFKNTAA